MRLTCFKQAGQKSHPMDSPCGWIWAFADVYNLFALVLRLAEELSGSFLLPYCFCPCVPTKTGLCLSCRFFWHLSYGYITGIIIKMICMNTHYFVKQNLKTPQQPSPFFVFWLSHQIIFLLWFTLQEGGGVGMGDQWKKKGRKYFKWRSSVSKVNLSNKNNTQHLQFPLCCLLRQVWSHLK